MREAAAKEEVEAAQEEVSAARAAALAAEQAHADERAKVPIAPCVAAFCVSIAIS